MKVANLGDYFLWMGQVVKCQWLGFGEKTIGFKVTKVIECDCGRKHTYEEGYDVVESSPMFQENAEPIKTISDK